MNRDLIEQAFPGLRESFFEITSPPTNSYNCIAWAASDTLRWWWPAPEYFWPNDVATTSTLDAFVSVYEGMGFMSCDDSAPENEFERIAIFVDADGIPSHASRQLETGRWTSKLGNADDIEHDLCALEGDHYGKVALIMKRRVKSPQ